MGQMGESRGSQRDVLSWLTNSALVYEPKNGGREGVAGSQPMSTAVYMEPKYSIFKQWGDGDDKENNTLSY